SNPTSIRESTTAHRKNEVSTTDIAPTAQVSSRNPTHPINYTNRKPPHRTKPHPTPPTHPPTTPTNHNKTHYKQHQQNQRNNQQH
ncbi:hypothetical protein RA281_28210, partial [Pseudomonas syringae pv. tagetis]